MTTAPKRGGRNILFVIIGLILACLVCVGVAFAVIGPSIVNVFNTVAAPLTISQSFMDALITKDYNKAFGLTHPSLRASYGSDPDGFQLWITSRGWQPSSVTLSNVHIVNNSALVNGTGTFSGSTQHIYIALQKDGDTWKITSLDVNSNPPTASPAQ